MARSRGSHAADRRGVAAVVVVSTWVAAVYAIAAAAPTFARRPIPFVIGYLALTLAMLWGVRAANGSVAARRAALVAALLFRMIATAGQPWLSDDLYRYVWDGRVQAAGIDPYAYSPNAPELTKLRDADWERINHRDVPTIYPPLAQFGFRALVACGAGTRGFRIVFGLLDFLTVLVLDRWLHRSGRPRNRVLLYAWNPVAVIETAGNGHLEAAGVLLMVLAGAWIIERRPWMSTLALAAGTQVKLVPILLLPMLLRAFRRRSIALALLGLIALPIVAWSPGRLGFAPGTVDYAERWEHNAPIYPGIEGGIAALGIDRLLSPRSLARAVVGLLLVAWTLGVSRREDLPFDARALAILVGAFWLSPTLHPWYLLWVLPWAVLRDARPWLLWVGLVPLSYLAGPTEVPWGLRVVQHLPPLIWLSVDHWRRRELF